MVLYLSLCAFVLGGLFYVRLGSVDEFFLLDICFKLRFLLLFQRDFVPRFPFLCN